MIQIIGDVQPKRGEKGFNTKESSVKTEGHHDKIEMVNGEPTFKVNMNKKQLKQSKGNLKPTAPASNLFSPIQSSTVYENAPRMKMAKNWLT